MFSCRRGLPFLFSLAFAACAAFGAPVDLDVAPEDLPYEFIDQPVIFIQPLDHVQSRGFVVDLDRDGFDELVEVVRTGLVSTDYEGGRRLSNWQFNIDARFSETFPVARAGAAGDVTGDGFPEIIFVANGAPIHDNVLMIYDCEEDELVRSTVLPKGVDVNGDGGWDGKDRIVGVMDLPRPLVVLMRETGFDRYGRGVIAFDLADGDTAWDFRTAGNPHRWSTMINDLDGDGVAEVVIGTTAPCNLGGELVNGRSDDQSMLYVLEADGSLRWERLIGGEFSASRLDICDLDGDGAREIVTVSRSHRSGARDRMCVWRSADGALMAQTPVSEIVSSVTASPAPDGDGAVICAAFGQTGLQQYRWRDGRLGLGVSATSESGIVYVGRLDLLPDPGEELVAKTGAGDLLVLDQNLQPMMKMSTFKQSIDRVFVMTADRDPGRLLGIDGPGLALFAWRPRPRDMGDLALTGGGVAVSLALVGVVVAVRRRRRRPLSAFPVRDVHARLMRELSQVSHDHLGVTRGLDRIVTQLEYLASDLGRTDELLQRTRAAWSEFEESGWGRLEEILTLAAAGDLPADEQKEAFGNLNDARRRLASVFAADLERDQIAKALPSIRTRVADSERALKRIRRRVESYFVTDLGRMVRRVLLLREDEMSRAGVELELRLPEDGACSVRIDSVDLRFVVDNLVNNAMYALSGSEERRLRVQAKSLGEIMELEIDDSGCGIAAEHHQRIFSSGFSGRQSGGLGLARSREILAGCGGELLLIRSEPSAGATFLLRLRRTAASVDSGEVVS